MKKILHDDYGNRAEIEEVVTLPYKNSPTKEKGYKEGGVLNSEKKSNCWKLEDEYVT